MQVDVATPRPGLDFIWLELTGRCNLECVHCYADSSPHRPLHEGMAEADWIAALDQAAELGCRKVQFIGGEPTIHPGLPALIEHARKIGYRGICVYTNGTHVTEPLKSVFIKNRVNLVFSVYGASSDIHDRVTLRQGSFAKTRAAIKWAIGAGLFVRAGVVAMAENAADVRRTERMLLDWGVRSVRTDRLRGFGRGLRARPAPRPMKELCGRCGHGNVCVSQSGEIHPCVFARFASLGDIKSGALASAFAGRTLGAFHEALADTLGARARGSGAEARRGLAALPAAGYSAASGREETCSPEEDPGPCDPETDPGNCDPETDPGDCDPETDPGDCDPETDPGDCDPEIDPGPCIPEDPDQNDDDEP